MVRVVSLKRFISWFMCCLTSYPACGAWDGYGDGMSLHSLYMCDAYFPFVLAFDCRTRSRTHNIFRALDVFCINLSGRTDFAHTSGDSATDREETRTKAHCIMIQIYYATGLSDVQGPAQSPQALAAKPWKPEPSQALEQAWLEVCKA